MDKQRKLAHEVDMTHYEADACIVWCSDSRFIKSKLHSKFVEREGFDHVDRVTIPGGAKSLAHMGDDPGKDFVLMNITVLAELHKFKRVILMVHSDCGAYGKINMPNGEEDFFRMELQNAKQNLLSHFEGNGMSGFEVTMLMADKEGLVEFK